MTRYLLSIFLLFIFLSLFFSCEKTGNDDNEKPTIEILEISDTMYINVIDSSVNKVKIKFTDNQALSTYKICLLPSVDMINPDSVVSGEKNKMDSLALNGALKSQKVSIFDSVRITISQNLIIPPTISRYEEKDKKTNTYAVRTGKYTLSVVCMDKAGNFDSIPSGKIITLKNAVK